MKNKIILLVSMALTTIIISSCQKHQNLTNKGASMKSKDSLELYNKKRDFNKTAEPAGNIKKKTGKKPIFVIQKHAASHLHYDFRLEIDGVLKSWAIPKGPSLDPSIKRLAMPTDDHPMAYASFEGTIPEGEYGAGTVMVWDTGTFDNIKESKGQLIPIDQSYENGQIEVVLHGKKLEGAFALIRIASSRYKKESWLLIKMRDEYADARRNLLTSEPNSALTGRTMEEIKKESDG